MTVKKTISPKKNVIGKLWLKITDKDKYREYKRDVQIAELKQRRDHALNKYQLFTLKKLKAFSATHSEINISHSGNAGDLIYALPTVKRIHELTGLRINFYLQLNQPMNLPPHLSHPLGGVRLNQKMADMLIPLISGQAYIHQCGVLHNEAVDLDLDTFRHMEIMLDRGNLALWYSYITGVTPKLHEQWLQVTPDGSYSDTIVIARSERYRNEFINYSFLNRYKNLLFIGLEAEFADIKQHVPGIAWLQVNDFKEMAGIIAGCKFFIGNQSFPFAIAEALKVPRILETNLTEPNVIPSGGDAHDFYFQEHLEALVEELNTN